MIPSFLEACHFSAVSLTQSQNLASEVFSARRYIPEEFIHRLIIGGSLGFREAKKLVDEVPSLEPTAWTDYWSEVAQNFEERDRFAAACMAYLFGSFPKDDTKEKQTAFSNQLRTFSRWCEQTNSPYEEIFIREKQTRIRFYLRPPKKIEGRHPVILFVNGLEGAAEEVAFSIEQLEEYPVGYAVLSVPGSWDYSEPMNPQSEGELQKVIDFIESVSWVDADRIGIIGFSFGAFWAMITTKVDPRIKFCVCNGIPLRHTFSPKKAFGLNPLISRALHSMLQASQPVELGLKLRALQKRASKLIDVPSAPILAMNGSADQIVDVRDTLELGSLKNNQVRIIPDAKHCAVDEFKKMTSLLAVWIKKHA